MSNCSKYILRDRALQEGNDHRDGSVTQLPVATSVERDYIELFRLLFGFSEIECKVYQILLVSGNKETREIAEQLNKDRSTVSRALKRLLEEGFVTRRRRILRSGGHAYEYSARNPGELRTHVHGRLEEWSDSAHERLEEFLREVSQ